MRYRVFGLSLFLVPLSCAHRSSTVPLRCEVAGADAILKPGQLSLIGEVHGTAEAPEFVQTLACQAAKKGHVSVALEVPEVEAPRLRPYFEGAATRAEALGDAFWRRSLQDGRSSRAVFDLVTGLRGLREQGASVQLILFDVDAGPRTPEERDKLMAENLLRHRRPESPMLVLVGNLHNQKVAGAPWKPDYVWMANHLVAAKVPMLSLKIRGPSGSAWVCRGSEASGCAPVFVAGRGKGAFGFDLTPTPDGRYDGFVDLPSTRASPPVGIPEKAAELEAQLRAVEVVVRANQAYEQKDFARCADLLASSQGSDLDSAYTRACCLALAGRRDEAFAQIGLALKLGARREDIKADQDFVPLHGDARWLSF